MSFSDRAGLAAEIEQSLRCGRAFLPETSEVPVLSDVVLVLVHPEHGGEHRLPAQVVMANEHGTGLSLPVLDAETLAKLDAFVASSEVQTPAQSQASAQTDPLSDTQAEETAQALASGGGADAAASKDDNCARGTAQRHEDEDEDGDEASDSLDVPQTEQGECADEPTGSATSTRPSELQSDNRQQRLRNLSPTEQLKVARRGELADRLMVERIYGKQVWEALLQNPRLTVPEVAKIARKGTVPKPLIDLIVDNASWVKAEAVRRALLTNPKLGTDAVLKLLRLTPKHELKLIEKGSAYGAAVREAARKLLRQ